MSLLLKWFVLQRGKALFFHRVRRVLGFLLANWYKFAILGIMITMIVLVSIHVRV